MKQTIVLALLVVGLALGASVYVHPDGADGVLRMLGIERRSEPQAASGTRTPDRLVDRTAAADKQIRNGDVSYDQGDFDQAYTAYMIAMTSAQTEAQRLRAETGQQRAVLAWALTHDPPPADYADRTARDRLTELTARARARGTEDAWLEVALFAAGAALKSDLRDAVSSALDLAAGGGAVEMRLRAALAAAGPKERSLLAAMKARGLGAGLEAGATTALTGAGALRHPTDDDEPSGIGGVGSAPRVRVPFGAFTAEMREKLKGAAQAEADGLEHFRLAGPEGTDRGMHRREAHRLLKEARDVFNEALEMDPDAREVERRLQTIMRALGQLNKERVAGE